MPLNNKIFDRVQFVLTQDDTYVNSAFSQEHRISFDEIQIDTDTFICV